MPEVSRPHLKASCFNWASLSVARRVTAIHCRFEGEVEADKVLAGKAEIWGRKEVRLEMRFARL